MIKVENVKLFQYGRIPNGYFIPEEVVKDALESFINMPVMIYNEDDFYNKDCYPIGIISKINNMSDNYVYGDIAIFKEDNINEFKNFEITIDKRHVEYGMLYIDKFSLSSVSFDIK